MAVSSVSRQTVGNGSGTGQKATLGEMTLSHQLKELKQSLDSLSQRMWLLEQDYAPIPGRLNTLRTYVYRIRRELKLPIRAREE